MVCIRCKIVVKGVLSKLGVRFKAVELGEVELTENISLGLRDKLSASLQKCGLELMEDNKSMLVEKIKELIYELVHYSDEPLVFNLSDYLSHRLHYEYTYMANLFSEVQGITIERFFICNKIERVKELLVYNKSTLTDIAYKMHYSSVSHLSSQFKKVTGLTPSHFKQLKQLNRPGCEYIH